VFTLVSLRSSLLLAALLGGLAPAPETHQFDLTRDQKQSFTFAVDQPGRIVARVTWQGAPLAVRLIGPGGTVAQRTARGSVELAYAVTPADVSKGSAWRVALQSATRTGDVIAVVAKGTVVIEHPPGDIEKLRAQSKALNTQREARFRAQAAQRQPQVAAAQKAQLARYQQAVDQARQRTQAARLQQVVALRTRAVVQPVRVKTITSSATTPTSGSAGSTSPPPTITSLSSSEGQPGDAILINGTGFGDGAAGAGTTVHIIVAPGKDIQFGAPDYQSGTQIQTSIPSTISGVAENPHAAIYVKRVGNSSQLIPFHFKPAIATASIPVKSDHVNLVDESDCDSFDNAHGPEPGWPMGDVAHGGADFCGGSGNDLWNRGQTLKNGWTVVSVGFGGKAVYPDADVYVSQSHAGTPDLSFTIHWWTSGAAWLGDPGRVFYSPEIIIQGPAGIPWQ